MNSVAEQILALAALTGAPPAQISHYAAGRSGAGDIVVETPQGRCIVITAMRQTGVDVTFASTVALASAGSVQNPARASELFAGTLPVMYLMPAGRNVITLNFLPLPSEDGYTLFSIFELPDIAAEIIKPIATRRM